MNTAGNVTSHTSCSTRRIAGSGPNPVPTSRNVTISSPIATIEGVLLKVACLKENTAFEIQGPNVDYMQSITKSLERN